MFFKRRKAKESEPFSYHDELPETNEYYFALSHRFKIAKYLSFLTLILFIVFMVSRFGNEITVENLRYILKYMDTKQGSISRTYSDIQYDSVGNADFALYKGDLTVVGTDGMHIYDINGKSILSAKYGYLNPKVLVSDQYVLIYDLSGSSFSVYNSFGLLYEETLDYPISSAAISDSGMFLIATRTKEYRSVVYCYNKDFKRIYNWYSSDKYVLSTSIDSDGSQFIISACNVTDRGDFRSEILICNPNVEDKKAEMSFEDEAVIQSAFFEDQSYALLSDLSLYLYDSFHRQKLQYVYPSGQVPTAFYTSEEMGFFMVASHENVVGNESSVIFFNSSGETVYTGTVSGDIYDVRFGQSSAYVLTNEAVFMIDFSAKKSYDVKIDKHAKKIFLVGSDTLLICYTSRTEVKNINEMFFR